ncbi:hypothetical protein PV327_005915 [Microctonus hyperodae]|uniref:Uncharacterized protein n=1 Tax=Microctonus hyperodae TaxID=165561 RepID=A0AA39L086_MICHY|nr:hypothetical protein PV327_005915 [Microctonus hyperodae]
MIWCTILLFFVTCTWADNSINSRNYSPINCIELKAQEDLALDKTMGKWYVVEIMEHNPIPEDSIGSRMVVDMCPIIKLERVNNLLRLLWTEEGGSLEYKFRVSNSGAPGVWISVGLQNGTLVKNSYTQFGGSVHVMKAVAQHMVLTFCSGSPDYQLYSILMGRQHILDRSAIVGVHNLLKRRLNYISNTRSTCAKGNAMIVVPNNTSLMILIVTTLSILSKYIRY